MTHDMQWTARHIRALQRITDLTNERFASKLRISTRTLNNWKNDGYRQTEQARRALSDFLDDAPETVRHQFSQFLISDAAPNHSDSDTEALDTEHLVPMIAAGLRMPDATHSQWQPPSDRALSWPTNAEIPDSTRRIGENLLSLRDKYRLSDYEVRQLATLAGNVVDLDLRITLEIERDGSALVTYRHEMFNMTDRAFTRLTRELWFVYTTGPLEIKPVEEGLHHIAIQRAATTPNLAKFACRLSPALQPGDTAIVSYTCDGGKFVDEWYWREAIRRHTRHATVVMRRANAGRLVDCSATVEEADGAERSSAEGLVWDYDSSDLVITLTTGYLNPNQAVVMRWDVDDEHA